MQISSRSYMQPTPKNLRRLGDGLLAISTAITAYSIADGSNTIAIISLITGVLGKFLTNFFTK